MVKNPEVKTEKATIHYYDIGEYLTREEKLNIISGFKSFANEKLSLKTLQPNVQGDWINERNASFDNYIPLEPKKKFDLKTNTFFNTYAIGVASNRDAWVNNFSEVTIKTNMQKMIEYYNENVELYKLNLLTLSKGEALSKIDNNPTKISWTVNLKKDLEKNFD